MNTAELRLLYRDETVLLDGGMAPGLTVSYPPVTHNFIEHNKRDGGVWYEDELEEEPADRNGQNLSAAMVTLIGGIRADFTGYGPRHPIRRALAEWERSCRRRHRSDAMRWRDHLQGPICGEMLRASIEGGCSYLWCAERWGIGYDRAKQLIQAGERFMAERYARSQDDALGIVHDRDRCEQCREEAR